MNMFLQLQLKQVQRVAAAPLPQLNSCSISHWQAWVLRVVFCIT
jgi:hypothetical protein